MSEVHVCRGRYRAEVHVHTLEVQHTLSEVELKQNSSSPVQPAVMRIGSGDRSQRKARHSCTTNQPLVLLQL